MVSGAEVDFLSEAEKAQLRKAAQALVADGKGIWAADDSADAAGVYLKVAGLENTEDNRRKYKELLLSSEKIENYISGVIMMPEMFYQKSSDGTRFADLLNKKGVLVGVNVDKGVIPVTGTDNEFTTQGLDDMGVRTAQYKKDGAQFAKLRCAYRISAHTPSALILDENARVLARYASICQQNGLVPIVEPDIALDGNYSIQDMERVTGTTLAYVYKALSDHHVYLEGTVLKPAMISPGKSSPKSATPEQVGEATVAAFKRQVPAAIPGILFLSGGHEEKTATSFLNAVNKSGAGKLPWKTTFCFGRALQATVWSVWKGGKSKDNDRETQEAFLKRARLNGLASQGKYLPELEE